VKWEQLLRVNIGELWIMVFSATFNNISVIFWRSVLLVEETRLPGENHHLNIILVFHRKYFNLGHFPYTISI